MPKGTAVNPSRPDERHERRARLPARHFLADWLS
jgi:hypothetical protein